MIARPAASALACGNCRNSILRAVLLRPAPHLLPAQRASRQTSQCPPAPRLFSSGRTLRSDTGQAIPESQSKAEELDGQHDELIDDGEEDTAPWFLQVEPPRHPPIQHVEQLPKVPEDAPALLQPMMKYIYEDMGLDHLSLLDLRDLDPPAALGPNLIMLFGTARSERHLHICSNRFVRWLKRNHKVEARADGLIGPGELRTKLRRMRKKAKLLGTNSSMVPGGDNGISTGWVCVNFAINEDGAKETASFDESGRFAGFGAPRTGTTVVVQVMTENRRAELDLETLWQGILRRSLESMQKMRGNKVIDAAEVDASLSSRIQMPQQSSSAQQWEALKRASQQQHRYFSTSARRHEASDRPVESFMDWGHAEVTAPGDARPDLGVLGQQISDLQTLGTPVSSTILKNLIAAVLQAPPATEGDTDTAPKRLVLVDQLCQLADERGMSVLSTDWLVTLIESIVLSPAYGPELQRAQTNLEFVLMERRSSLDPEQVIRLMAAHARRMDWERFWDVFRVPARFQVARTPALYEFAYRVMAATGSRRLCIDALRWVYPEMLKEKPEVVPIGSLYGALKACILVADPAAEQLVRKPPRMEDLGTLEQNRLKNREFVRVLKEVEGVRSRHVADIARRQREQVLDRFASSH